MDKGMKAYRSGRAFQSSSIQLQITLPRYVGKLRAVTLKGATLNADKIFGAIRTARETTDKIFCENDN